MIPKAICAAVAAAFLFSTPVSALSVFAGESAGSLASYAKLGGQQIIGELGRGGQSTAQSSKIESDVTRSLFDALGQQKGAWGLHSFWSEATQSDATDAFVVLASEEAKEIPSAPLPASLLFLLGGVGVLLARSKS